MSSSTDIRLKIAEILASVTGAGQVQAWERYSANAKGLVQAYTDNGKIAGWLIRRVAVREAVYSSLNNRETATWTIRAYRSLIDAEQSELDFDLVLDRARAAFRQAPDLGGLVEDCVGAGETVGLQVISHHPVMFAGLLCHAAELELITNRLVPIDETVPESLPDFEWLHLDWDIPPHLDPAPTTLPLPAGTADASDDQMMET